LTTGWKGRCEATTPYTAPAPVPKPKWVTAVVACFSGSFIRWATPTLWAARSATIRGGSEYCSRSGSASRAAARTAVIGAVAVNPAAAPAAARVNGSDMAWLPVGNSA
jgi:hypothetical protein